LEVLRRTISGFRPRRRRLEVDLEGVDIMKRRAASCSQEPGVDLDEAWIFVVTAADIHRQASWTAGTAPLPAAPRPIAATPLAPKRGLPKPLATASAIHDWALPNPTAAARARAAGRPARQLRLPRAAACAKHWAGRPSGSGPRSGAKLRPLRSGVAAAHPLRQADCALCDAACDTPGPVDGRRRAAAAGGQPFSDRRFDGLVRCAGMSKRAVPPPQHQHGHRVDTHGKQAGLWPEAAASEP
jgi:hypothetical protein